MKPKKFGRTTVQGATFSIRGQLYYGHVNAIALVLSSGRLSTTQHFYEFVVPIKPKKFLASIFSF